MSEDNTYMVKDILKDLCKDLRVAVERNSKEFERNLMELEICKKRLLDVETENEAIRKELTIYKRALDMAADQEFGEFVLESARKCVDSHEEAREEQ